MIRSPARRPEGRRRAEVVRSNTASGIDRARPRPSGASRSVSNAVMIFVTDAIGRRCAADPSRRGPGRCRGRPAAAAAGTIVGAPRRVAGAWRALVGNGDGLPCGGTGVGGGTVAACRRPGVDRDRDEQERAATAATRSADRASHAGQVFAQGVAQQRLLELPRRGRQLARASGWPPGARRGSSGEASAPRAPRRRRTHGRRSACTSSGAAARSRTAGSPSRSTA